MISILTPSRGRPQYAKRMYDSAIKNPGCKIEVKFYLNIDDAQLEEYKRLLPSNTYEIGPDRSPIYSWNLLAENAKYDILFLIGDDAQFTFDNWGLKILEVFDQYPDKIVMTYPKVPTLGKSKCPHFCIHKNWVNAIGYFLPPAFYHWYADTWLREIAWGLDRFHLIAEWEMPIENIRDETTSRYHGSWQRERDDWIWNHTKRYREKDIETLKAFIENFKD